MPDPFRPHYANPPMRGQVTTPVELERGHAVTVGLVSCADCDAVFTVRSCPSRYLESTAAARGWMFDRAAKVWRCPKDGCHA